MKSNRVNAQYRVLVVEDDEDVRRVLNNVVKQLGHEPIEAHSVSKALKIIKGGKINLMLLDIYLRGATGLDLLKSLQRRKVVVPTVVVSGYISHTVADQLIQFGVQGLVTKPFRITRIASEIQRVIQPDEGVSMGELAVCPGFSAPGYQNSVPIQAGEIEIETDTESERRLGERIRMKLPVRAKTGDGNHLYMKLVDISSNGMRTHVKNLEIFNMGLVDQEIVFEIPVVARLTRINSTTDDVFAIGWEFDEIIQKYGEASGDGPAPFTADSTPVYSEDDSCQMDAVEPEEGAEEERRTGPRIGMKLPLRAKVGNGKRLNMELVDISTTGMQALSESLEIFELKRISAAQQFVFEIPLMARLAWIKSRTDDTFAIGWAFDPDRNTLLARAV